MLAKEVVQIRNSKNRLRQAKSQLSSVSLQTHQMQSTHTMVQAMKGGAKAMHIANQQMSPAALAKIMKEFEKQSDTSQMTTEMMDDLFNDDEIQEEADSAVLQIFDELGVEATQNMQSVPVARQQQMSEKQQEEDLMRQLQLN